MTFSQVIYQTENNCTNHSKSSTTSVSHEVPQGSTLGPILFFKYASMTYHPPQT